MAAGNCGGGSAAGVTIADRPKGGHGASSVAACAPGLSSPLALLSAAVVCSVPASAVLSSARASLAGLASLLVGLLAGIGFTMAIFVGGLAFSDAALLGAAKMGILGASATAAVLGLIYGFMVRHKLAL